MALAQNFAGFTLSGPRTVGPAPLPAGLSRFQVSFDTAGFTAGQVVWLTLDFSFDGGASWQTLVKADFTGPWLDKQGNLQTLVGLALTLPSTSSSGWQFRGSLVPVNGPVVIGAGSLAAS